MFSIHVMTIFINQYPHETSYELYKIYNDLFFGPIYFGSEFKAKILAFTYCHISKMFPLVFFIIIISLELNCSQIHASYVQH